MSERPTPETDKQAVGAIGFYSCATVPAELARKLERERDEARDLHAKAIEERRSTECEVDAMLERALTAERERDEARAVLREIAGLDTSQLASPQQCGAVALSADYLVKHQRSCSDALTRGADGNAPDLTTFGVIEGTKNRTVPAPDGAHACVSDLSPETLLAQRDEARAALQRLADCDWVISLPDRMDAVRAIAREALEKMEAASHVSPADADRYRSRELAHLAGVVGALRDRNDRLMGLLRDVERETRRPSERFDEVWQEVREVLRG